MFLPPGNVELSVYKIILNSIFELSIRKNEIEAKVSSRKMLGDVWHVNMLGLSNSNSYRNTEDGVFFEFLVF